MKTKGFTFEPGKNISEIACETGLSNCVIARAILDRSIAAFSYIDALNSWVEVPSDTMKRCAFDNIEQPVTRHKTSLLQFGNIVPVAYRHIYGWDKIYISKTDMNHLLDLKPKPKATVVEFDEKAHCAIVSGERINLTKDQLACVKVIVQRNSDFLSGKVTVADMPESEILSEASMPLNNRRLRDKFKSVPNVMEKIFEKTGPGRFRLKA